MITTSLTLALALAVTAPSPAAKPAGRAAELPAGVDQCTPAALFDDLRQGLASGSPALKRYLAKLLREAALTMPAELLVDELARTTDPAMIEVLGAALAAKAENAEDPKMVKPLLARAIGDDDPAARAAAVRALRATGSVELMKGNAEGRGSDVDYARLIQDEAPEVREAVVENLVAEDDEVYSGHSAELSEAAVDAALASEDPAATARILSEVSTEAVGAETSRDIQRELSADEPAVRAASARALGGLAPPVANGANGTRDALVRQYQSDDDVAVRRAILEALARLERKSAIPLFESLRPVDARLDADITAWIAVLGRGLPEWAVILREKARLSP